jgi:hypothetical protein
MGPEEPRGLQMGPNSPAKFGWDPTLLQRPGRRFARLGARAFSRDFRKAFLEILGMPEAIGG